MTIEELQTKILKFEYYKHYIFQCQSCRVSSSNLLKKKTWAQSLNFSPVYPSWSLPKKLARSYRQTLVWAGLETSSCQSIRDKFHKWYMMFYYFQLVSRIINMAWVIILRCYCKPEVPKNSIRWRILII